MNLINSLIKGGYLKSPEIISAFKKIDRRDFLRPADRGKSEINEPVDIGYGQTNSQPATVAFMLEKLRPKSGDKILDLGSGSGWTTALLAEIVGAPGRVYGVERISELRDFAEANVKKYNFNKNTVQIICSDGFYGLPNHGQFDKIMISAAGQEIPPELVRELKIGGRLIMPVGQKLQTQTLVVMEKLNESEFRTEKFPGYIFVPLVTN